MLLLSILFLFLEKRQLCNLDLLDFFCRRRRLLIRFSWGLVVRINNATNFSGNGVQFGPHVGIFFGVDEILLEPDLEKSSLRVYRLFVGMRIELLVLCDFEGDKVRGDHVADHLELGETLDDDLVTGWREAYA